MVMVVFSHVKYVLHKSGYQNWLCVTYSFTHFEMYGYDLFPYYAVYSFEVVVKVVILTFSVYSHLSYFIKQMR